MFKMTYTDPDTYESKDREFQTLDEAKNFLANNWRISIAYVKPENRTGDLAQYVTKEA